MSWQGLCGDLPAHEDEVMASHSGRPTEAEHVANGATAPPGWAGGSMP
jgi:hypothetical protein